MPDTPIEKVQFSKRDIVSLHELPSAQAHDPIIVKAGHGLPGLRRLHGAAGLIVVLVSLVALFAASAFIVVERGWTDGFVFEQAKVALAKAAGEDFATELTGASVRVTGYGQLALEARNVTITPLHGPGEPGVAERVRLVLNPWALLGGRLEVGSIELSGVSLSMPAGKGFRIGDLAGIRIDAIEGLLESGFVALNRIAKDMEIRGTRVVRLARLKLSGGDDADSIVIEQAKLVGDFKGRLSISGQVSQAGKSFELAVIAGAKSGEKSLSLIEGRIDDLNVDLQRGVLEERRFGAKMTLGLVFRARRAGPGADPVLEMSAESSRGTIVMGGTAADLNAAQLNFSYVPSARKIEIMPSILKVGETTLPFSGGLIDIDRLPNAEGSGVAFDIVILDGIAAPEDSDDPPFRFDAKAFGRILPGESRVIADQLAVATRSGSMLGSASFHFLGDQSPEINLFAETQGLATTAVKQLWPYWLGPKPRQWVLNNLYGGQITNGKIQLAIPAGHFKEGIKIPFTPSQFQIDFDIQRARMNVAGDIPPLRDTVGHIRLRGTSVQINVTSATAYFPTGRKVAVSNGLFSISATDARPLMADLKMDVTGQADAVAELITYHPINALDRIALVPEDLSGEVSSKVEARFGLVAGQSPPPDWKVDLALKEVDIAKPVEGRLLSKVDGRLVVTPEKATLSAGAMVDGVPLKLNIVQPVGGSPVNPERSISGTLDNKAREKLAPGTGALIDGPIGFSIVSADDGVQQLALDLKQARLTIPGIGWTKSKGIAAKAEFALHSEGDAVEISDFRLGGDGFSVAGDLSVRNGKLSSAVFSKIALSPRDDYRLEVEGSARGYRLKVAGSAIDLRSLISSIKETASVAETEATKAAPHIDVEGHVDVAYGDYDERLNSVSLRYAGQGGRTDLLDFKAVTQSGQAAILAVSGAGNGGGESIEMSSGDAGAVARFAGIYGKMTGGLLNIRLSRENGPLRRGVIDIRNFTIVDEDRLRSLVSSPTGRDGRSLNDAVRGKIDVTKAKFQVANARVELGNGVFLIKEGVIRGLDVGAAFRGMARDANGIMDLSGSFMPAYGLNRLLGEVPILGAFLGNGRQSGLIGITFRLTGEAGSPRLELNPLSVITPGVFRSIFEYR